MFQQPEPLAPWGLGAGAGISESQGFRLLEHFDSDINYDKEITIRILILILILLMTSDKQIGICRGSRCWSIWYNKLHSVVQYMMLCYHLMTVFIVIYY